MSMLERVNQNINEAMRSRDQARLSALRLLKSSLVNRRVEKGRDLDDSEAQQVVATLVKQRRDSIDQFTKAGRQDLAEKETAEIAVLESYLPPPADPAEIEQAITAALTETGATSAKDLGRVMKAVMSKLGGRNVDGKAVNERVRRKLGS
jgi:uncharacterized protein